MAVKLTDAITGRERERLRLLRLEQDWSYREMAERIGIPEATLRHLLDDAGNRPRERTVFKVRRWLANNSTLLHASAVAR